jgi:hypothetical protein
LTIYVLGVTIEIDKERMFVLEGAMIENMSPANHHAEVPTRSALATVLAPVVLAPVIVALLLTAFAWPAARLAPRDLPVGVAGPAADVVAGRLHAGLAGSPQAVDVHRYPDETAARRAVEEREVYGAIIAGPDGVTVLTTSAASPAVAQLLSQAVTSALSAMSGAVAPPATAQGALTPRILDVVPTPPGDPRGVALAACLFPLVLAGMVVSGLVTSTTRPGVRQVGLVAVTSAAVSLASTGVLHGWLGILGGSWWADAGALASLALAVATAVAGLRALFGIGGFVFGAVLFVFVGNPWSGFTSAPELLPRAVGTIGELLPPGAGGSLLRNVAFFNGHGSDGHVLVLTAWAVAGVTGICVGALRAARRNAAVPGDGLDGQPGFHGQPGDGLDGQPEPAAFDMEPVTLTHPAAPTPGAGRYRNWV